jgi:hypothetical protein
MGDVYTNGWWGEVAPRWQDGQLKTLKPPFGY